MRIAITGARGRLGRVLRRHFEAAGEEVEGFSRNADAVHLSLAALVPLLEQDSLDVLLHLGWSTVPATSEQTPGLEWTEDLPLLANILRTLVSRGKRAPMLLFFSSCAVYGEPECGHVLAESDTPAPKGWYATGKLAAENLLERFRAQHGVPSCVLRVSNPYGFTQGDQCMQGVIPTMLAAARGRSEFIAWGDGDAVKDYLHIDDLSAAVGAALQGQLQGTYNVASGESRSLSEVANLVEACLGTSLTIRHEMAKPWDVQHGRYSHDALTEATGWAPKVLFEEGLKRFLTAAEQG